MPLEGRGWREPLPAANSGRRVGPGSSGAGNQSPQIPWGENSCRNGTSCTFHNGQIGLPFSLSHQPGKETNAEKKVEDLLYIEFMSLFPGQQGLP